MRKITILLLCLSLVGCASAEGRGLYFGIYPGVRSGIDNITGRSFGFAGYGLIGKIFYIIDLPFSFIQDTILLPYDTFFNYEEEKNNLENNNIIDDSDLAPK